jgi:protein-ribulosamine 3-kinase
MKRGSCCERAHRKLGRRGVVIERKWVSVEQALQAALGVWVQRRTVRTSGAAVHAAYDTGVGRVFVKSGPPSTRSMFDGEAAGLKALAQTRTLRTPRVLALGAFEGGAFVALEWIELGRATRSSEAVLGEHLAWQHRTTQAEFGWSRNNTVGPTPQVNTPSPDWVAFLREQRLRYQLELALEHGGEGALYDQGQRLCESLGCFFSDYHPVPSLLHGDLWAGNWGTDTDGMPVVFDPAVYFGDREADIAMTRLFGGFGPAFYAAYQSTWPLDPGAETRSTLYNLYHVLNHFNLFGGAYRSQAQDMIERLLAEAGK